MRIYRGAYLASYIDVVNPAKKTDYKKLDGEKPC